MYNLMRRAAQEFDLILVAFTEQSTAPPPELLEFLSEIVLVHRAGSHALPFTGRPEVVEEFDSPAFRAALRQTVRKWNPAVAQLEFTQLAQYAADCHPARTVLVEHDITYDLSSNCNSSTTARRSVAIATSGAPLKVRLGSPWTAWSR